MEPYRRLVITIAQSLFDRLVAEGNEGDTNLSPSVRHSMTIDKALAEYFAGLDSEDESG